MNVNLHILNASDSLTLLSEDIKRSFEKFKESLIGISGIPDIDVVVSDNPSYAIPEIGIGGYTLNANSIFIYLDSKFPNISSSIAKELKRTLTHETHHAMRWASLGYGKTLAEAIITEGLADHFDLEINGGNPEPWSKALAEDQIRKLLLKAKEEFDDKNYDHNEWFFGSKKRNMPRWAGYSLGFKIVGDYLERNKDKKPSELYNTKTENFLN